MNFKKFILSATIILLAFSWQLPAKKSKPAEVKKEPTPIYIAPQVAAVFDANVQQRQNRNDIPLNYLQTLYLPAQQNMIFPVFLFQIKNADLNLIAPADAPDLLKASFHAFIRIYRIENGTPGTIVKERYIPFNPQEAKATFLPEVTNYYSIAGDIFPAGTYLLALGISSTDFSKISVCFHEFTLPDFTQPQGKLDTTPVFSVKSIEQLPAAETKLIIHKNAFLYSTLLLNPSLVNEYRVSENLDLFFFVLGCTPDSSNAYSLQTTYRIKKDGKEIVKLSPVTINGTIVEQPIPFSFTEVTRDAKGNEKSRAEKKLEPGEYVLEIELLDNTSKATGLKEFKFKIV